MTPDYYQILKPGDIIQPGDEFFDPHDLEWTPEVLFDRPWVEDSFPTRRKVEIPQEAAPGPHSIKIEIEWSSSISASLKINVREMRVEISPREGTTKLTGIEYPEASNTFGGILASELFGLIGDAMQAEAIASEEADPSGETDTCWSPLTDRTAQDVADRLF